MTALGSRHTSKVKEEQDWLFPRRAESDQRSRAPLGAVRPSLQTPHMGAPRSLHRSRTRANMFTTRIPALAPHVDMEPVSPEIPTIIQPQDEDSIPITWHQEGKRDGNEEHEHEQRPPQPESQPEPRRSERIKAINKRQDALPPKVKTSAKSTGRKRAVRKK